MWGPAEYAKASGREGQTINVLQARVASGLMSLSDARKAAENQGIDPDKIGKAAK